MNTALVQFRCDADLKNKTTALYESLGLDLPSAFRLFMKRSLQVHGLPFPVTTLPTRPRCLEEMSKAEFDAMMEPGFKDMEAGKFRPAEDVFDELEKEYGF
ncbi:MAG: type II toxin-antitoxin system RelB/DinJ family antitoxin [Phascolarctobacterium sp.]|nr:type II toxin-antitoxin system RelB/DinJ family antitoxin [Candidatus Phascolarctobacterium caballi]